VNILYLSKNKNYLESKKGGKGLIADGVPEIEEYMEEVLPDEEEQENFKDELLDIVVEASEFFPDTVD
jgi:hypothetical protein